MPNSQSDQEVDELVNYKVRKRVAKKVMKDLYHQVEQIEQQIQFEQKSKIVLMPLLLLLTGIVISLAVYCTDAIRLLSGLIN